MSGGWSPIVNLACHRGARPKWDDAILGFVAVQTRIDRRDPKLAQAPLRHEPEYLEFE